MSIMDFPEAIADVLGVSDGTGGLLISVVLLMTIALALTAAELEILPMIIVLLAAAGLFTAFGWLDPWFMVLATLTICGLFGVRFAKGVGASG